MSHSNLFYDATMPMLRFLTGRFGKITIEGIDNIPASGGGIVVANHISYVDPLLLGSHLALSGRRTRALAKESLFRVPVVKNLFIKWGHIPVHRATDNAKNSLSTAIERINEGEVIGVYPEGTIPRNGEWLGDFKTGATRLALETDCWIVPVVQVGSEKILPRNSKNKGKDLLKSLLKRPEVTIRILPPFNPKEELSYFESNKDQVKLGTQLIREHIVSSLSELKPQPII